MNQIIVWTGFKRWRIDQTLETWLWLTAVSQCATECPSHTVRPGCRRKETFGECGISSWIFQKQFILWILFFLLSPLKCTLAAARCLSATLVNLKDILLVLYRAGYRSKFFNIDTSVWYWFLNDIFLIPIWIWRMIYESMRQSKGELALFVMWVTLHIYANNTLMNMLSPFSGVTLTHGNFVFFLETMTQPITARLGVSTLSILYAYLLTAVDEINP